MRPTSSAAQLEYRRQLGGRLLAQGQGVREVARLLDVSPSSVVRWKQARDQGGESALRAIPHRGPLPRLSPVQKGRWVYELTQGAQAAGYATELWPCPRLAEVIARLFGVRYHPAQVWRLVRQLGWPCQKPEHRARERDESAIQSWHRHTWPQLKKSARA